MTLWGQGLRGARTRVVAVMATRLVFWVAVLATALLFVGVGRDDAERAETWIYATIAAGFLTSALFAYALQRTAYVGPLAAAQLLVDVCIVTSLVSWTGGADSIFSFLYLPISLYGSILFERKGAYGAALLSSIGFGVALALAEGLGTRALYGGVEPRAPLTALWIVQAGALLVVALLATGLLRELHWAGQRLEESASDLQRLRNLHERTVESLTSGLLTVDPAGTITSLNPEARRILALQAGDALGVPIEELLPGSTPLLQRGGDRMQLHFEGPDGDERHLGLSASVLRDAEGEPAGHVVIFQDLTDVRRMEEELRRSERLATAGTLAANMAHEIRNPLAAISGSIEILRDERGPTSEPGQRRRLMDIVLREVVRLDQLIADFLLFARPAPPKPEPIPLRDPVDETLEVYEAARPSNVSVEVEIPPGLLVLADAKQLRQMLWNLVLNASQAMEERGGRLRIAARGAAPAPQEPGAEHRNEPAGRSWVELRVEDTGPGIAPDVMSHVFDPFFTTKKGGSGLGLANVHRIVEAHGGTLVLDSRVGEGTTFVLGWPAPEETL